MLCKEPLSLYRLTGAGFFYLRQMDMDELTVDEYGFVRLSGMKVCRITNDGRLEFRDGHRNRSRARGSHYVYATPEVFYRSIVEAIVKATLKANL